MPHDIPTTDIDISHHVQRGILMHLRQAGPQPYAQLKPLGLEGNAYNYHLRNLKTSKLVELRNGLYHLTHTGYLVSDAFSFMSHRLMLRPYHYTTLLITHGDSILVYKPTRQPQAGKICLPSGKIHYNDSYTQSIMREMKRRQLTDTYTIKEICPLNIRYTLEGRVAIHRPGILWHVEYAGEPTVRTTESGYTEWMPLSEALTHPAALAELREGLERLTTESREPIDMAWPLD